MQKNVRRTQAVRVQSRSVETTRHAVVLILWTALVSLVVFIAVQAQRAEPDAPTRTFSSNATEQPLAAYAHGAQIIDQQIEFITK